MAPSLSGTMGSIRIILINQVALMGWWSLCGYNVYSFCSCDVTVKAGPRLTWQVMLGAGRCAAYSTLHRYWVEAMRRDPERAERLGVPPLLVQTPVGGMAWHMCREKRQRGRGWGKERKTRATETDWERKERDTQGEGRRNEKWGWGGRGGTSWWTHLWFLWLQLLCPLPAINWLYLLCLFLPLH